MRKAIKDTNVVLNMAITPGIILVPSDMIILKNKVDGYNNVLTLATNKMKFGVNSDVIYFERVSTERVSTERVSAERVSAEPVSAKPANGEPGLNLLVTTVIGGILIAKFVL